MEITSTTTTTAGDIKVGTVFTETVQLAGDLTAREHRFVATAVDRDGNTTSVTALVDRSEAEVRLDYGTDEQVTITRQPFEAGYEQADARVFRASFRASRETGTATVRFEGQVADATRCTVAAHPRGGGRLNLYAEVTPTDDSLTEVTVAVIPTGKRIPAEGRLLGSVGGQHVYLIGVDGSADRAAHEARKAAKRAAAEARALLADAGLPSGF